MLQNCHEDGPDNARFSGELTWFQSYWRVIMTCQSGIESCRGRSTELSRRPKRLPMQYNSKAQTRFGASHRATRRKATYLALRPIGIVYQVVSGVSISIHRSSHSRRRQSLDARWYLGTNGVLQRTDSTGTVYAAIPLSRFFNGQP